MMMITVALVDVVWYTATTGSGDTSIATDVTTATDSQEQTCIYMYLHMQLVED